MEITVEIDEAALRRRLAIATPQTVRELNRAIGGAVLERTQGFLARMSLSRHKVADRLGARRTGFYENAPGRTVLRKVDENGAEVVVKNTPGLSRAYHDLIIRPVRRRALTIPIHRIAYGKRVGDLRAEGHDVFRPKGTNILAEPTGGKGKLRPLYVLVRSVTVPRDPGLLPSRDELRAWSREAAEDFFDSRPVLG